MASRHSKEHNSTTHKHADDVVNRSIDDLRNDYTPAEKEIYRANISNNEWRQIRMICLRVELELVQLAIDHLANCVTGSPASKVESLRTRYAGLLREVKRVDLHSKNCWRNWRLWHWIQCELRPYGVKNFRWILCM
jgi:hypothetical protein